jgi:glycosyltransferase involved in cell wall biosynthesis
MWLSLVVPVFDEAQRVEASLRQAAGYLRQRFDREFELIAVDDGSRDGSLAILQRLRGELPLRVIHLPHNRGKGAAIRAGMLAASGEMTLFSDADLSTPLTETARFLDALAAGADLAIGTRKAAEAAVTRPQALHRTLMGRGYTHLANLITGLDVSDYTCGFKAFSRQARRAIFPRCRLDRWSFDVEVLYLAHRLGLSVRELPVHWEDRPDSKVRLLRDTLGSFSELLILLAHHRRSRSHPRAE